MNRVIARGAAILGVIATTSGAQGLVDKPVMVVGDRWVSRTVDLWKNEETASTESRVTSVAGDAFEIRWKTLSSVTASKVGQSGVLKGDASTWTIENPRRVEGTYVALAFPIDVGKAWKFEYKIKNAESDYTVWKQNAKAESWDDIRVPAGSFKSLRVVYEIGWSRTYTAPWTGGEKVISGTSTVSVWYSPEAKRVVKREWFERNSLGGMDNQGKEELVTVDVKK